MQETEDIVTRLRNERRATRWTRGADADYPVAWEPHPLCAEAATTIATLRAEAQELQSALSAIVDKALVFFDGYVDRHLITYGEIQQARAAIDAAKADKEGA